MRTRALIPLVLLFPALSFAQGFLNCNSPSATCRAGRFSLLAGNPLCLNGPACTSSLKANSSTSAPTLTSPVTSGTAFILTVPATLLSTDALLSLRNNSAEVVRFTGIGGMTLSSDLVMSSGFIKPGTAGINSTQDASAIWYSGKSDAANAVGFRFNVVADLTTAGALIARFEDNNGTVDAVVDKDGNFLAAGSGTTGNPLPSVHNAQTAVPQSMEFGSGAADAGGVLAVSFATAFGAAPKCVCNDTNAAPVACGISTAANTTAVTFTIGSARADTVTWICIGQK